MSEYKLEIELRGDVYDALKNFTMITGVSEREAAFQALRLYLYDYVCEPGYPKKAVYKWGADIREYISANKEEQEQMNGVEKPCYILGKTVSFGKPYYKIAAGGHIVKTPEESVRFEGE